MTLWKSRGRLLRQGLLSRLREITFLLLALREIYRARLDGRAPDPDIVPEGAARAFADQDVLGRIELLLEHRRCLDLNANVGLTVENALLRI